MENFAEEDCISLICNGEFDALPDYSIGELFEGFFDNINYNVIKEEEIYVDFTGEATCDEKPCLVLIRFKVEEGLENFEIVEVKVNGEILVEEEILDLLEDTYIIKYEKEDNEIYELTTEGKNALTLTIDIIPGILKLSVDNKFKESLDTIKDKFSISAEYIPISEKEFTVRCKIIENNNTIFDIHAHAGSREQAKKIVDNWNNKAAEIYPQILSLLVD